VPKGQWVAAWKEGNPLTKLPKIRSVTRTAYVIVARRRIEGGFILGSEPVDAVSLPNGNDNANSRSADSREVDNLANIDQQLEAHTVVASLWSENDQATAAFMEEFSRVRQSNPGMTKAEAVQRTQKAMLEGRLKGMAAPVTTNQQDSSAKPPGNAPAY
jgi:flagellar biosynthesis GTPase FlhF